MLIKIIDTPAQGSEDDSLRIEYSGAEHNKTFQTESFTSPFSANFRKTLAWYFSQYPSQLAVEDSVDDDKGVVQKVIRGGQGLGEEMMGEDYELVKIAEDVSAAGFAGLDVQLISNRPEFFTELWETLVLPDSKYMLSTVAKSFTRQIGDAERQMLAPLSYNLKVTPPTSDHVAQLLQGSMETPAANNRDNDTPLRVLYWVARPQSVNEAFDGSNGINLALDANKDGGAIVYDVHKAAGLEKLTALLSDKENPVHVLHYDGPVLVDGDDVISFIVDEDQEARVSAQDLSGLLAQNQVGLLSIDSRRYLKHTPKKVLAMIADTAYEQGLGNVLGLSQITNPWLSDKCFDGVYRQIAIGHELSQAVVEARKAQQRNITTDLMTPEPLNFHDWSLLVHYSWQQVQFFESGLSPEQQDDPNYLTNINQKLYGYQSMMLPPLQFTSSDGQALCVMEHLNQNGCAAVSAPHGGGKSSLVHHISTYLAVNNQLDFGFYFDFAKEAFKPEQMLEMLGNLLQVEGGEHQDIFTGLGQKRCLFVFDDIDPQAYEHWSELNDFIGTLRQAGHKIVATGNNVESLNVLDMPAVQLQPLSLIEQKILAAHTLRQLKDIEVKDLNVWHELLQEVGGNPWLTIKAMAKLSTYSVGALTDKLKDKIKDKANVVEQFYQWQWSNLSGASRQMLLLCSEVHGLLLEMVATAADQKTTFEGAAQLYDLLGHSDGNFGDWVTQWNAAGFVNTYPHGRLIDNRCLAFLQQKRTEVQISDEVKLHFSQLLCEGVRMLSAHVLKQPNQNITNNLLFNRRSWVEHFERLWQNKDYRGFFNCKNAFDQLLMQAQLLSEIELWSMDMLSRKPIDDNSDINDKVAWLSLAGTFALNAKCDEYPVVSQAQNDWREWLDGLKPDMDDQDRPLFLQAVNFLQACYQRQEQWQDAITVSNKALAVYLQSQAWQRVIRTYKALADFHSKMDDEETALEYECRILDDVPYESAPPSFKSQQMVEIMLARLTRGNTMECQKMLDQLKDTTEEGQSLGPMLDNVQCEIHLKDEDYQLAMPYLAEQWLMTLEANQPGQLEPVQQRMQYIAEKMGEEAFKAAFEPLLPEGAQSPV